MKTRLLLTLALSLLAFAPRALRAENPPAAPPKGQKIVATGHSFHMPLLGLIDQIAKAANVEGHTFVVRQGIGGSKVSQHWDLADDKNLAKKALREGGVDLMTCAPNWVVPDEAIEKFTNLALEKNPDLRLLVQVSWFPWDGMQPPLKVAKNEDRDAKTVADLHAAYDPFRDTIRKQAEEINAKLKRQVVYVVPVGEAVLRLREKVLAGEVPGVSKQSELFTDQIGHAKSQVLQLAAYCQFACIYRRSPVGLTCFEKPGDEASHKLNRLLQTIAWESALAEPLSGVK